MADTKISALTSGNPAQSGDEIPIARAGANYKITAGSIASLATVSPAGSDTYVQFNDGGAFGAEAGFAYNKTTNTLASEKLALGTAGAASGVLTLSGSTSGTVTLQPAAAAGTYTLTLPTSDGASGEVLTTDGSGVLSWAASAGGSPGGSNTQLQYNNAGAFGGTSGITTTGTELTIASGTKTASAPVLDITQTWNNAAVTFTGLKFNVTNTASNSASNLVTIQTGGVNRFVVERSGKIVVPQMAYDAASPNSATGGISCDPYNQPIALLSSVEVYGQGYVASGKANCHFTSTTYGAALASSGVFAWSSTASANGSGDLILARDAANTLAQRNGTNAQTLRVYNTYTDASNYERAKIAWDTNVLKIGTEKAGTGTARALELQTDGTTRMTVESGGVVRIPAGTYNDAKLQIGSAAANAAALWYDATSGNTGLGISADGSSWVGSINKQGFLLGNQASSLWVKWGTTSSFPGLKRSSATLQARLADDTDYAIVDCAQIGTTKAYTVATLPAAGTAGRRAYVTDATTPTFLGTLTGGGAVVCPVFDNGTAWVAG